MTEQKQSVYNIGAEFVELGELLKMASSLPGKPSDIIQMDVLAGRVRILLAMLCKKDGD